MSGRWWKYFLFIIFQQFSLSKARKVFLIWSFVGWESSFTRLVMQMHLSLDSEPGLQLVIAIPIWFERFSCFWLFGSWVDLVIWLSYLRSVSIKVRQTNCETWRTWYYDIRSLAAWVRLGDCFNNFDVITSQQSAFRDLAFCLLCSLRLESGVPLKWTFFCWFCFHQDFWFVHLNELQYFIFKWRSFWHDAQAWSFPRVAQVSLARELSNQLRFLDDLFGNSNGHKKADGNRQPAACSLQPDPRRLWPLFLCR